MNIPFTTPSEELNNEFYKSERTRPCYVKRTSIVGGMRASIYNAMPVQGVQQLVNYMKEFELENR